jgi:hypothetical protein
MLSMKSHNFEPKLTPILFKIDKTKNSRVFGGLVLAASAGLHQRPLKFDWSLNQSNLNSCFCLLGEINRHSIIDPAALGGCTTEAAILKVGL